MRAAAPPPSCQLPRKFATQRFGNASQRSGNEFQLPLGCWRASFSFSCVRWCACGRVSGFGLGVCEVFWCDCNSSVPR